MRPDERDALFLSLALICAGPPACLPTGEADDEIGDSGETDALAESSDDGGSTEVPSEPDREDPPRQTDLICCGLPDTPVDTTQVVTYARCSAGSALIACDGYLLTCDEGTFYSGDTYCVTLPDSNPFCCV